MLLPGGATFACHMRCHQCCIYTLGRQLVLLCMKHAADVCEAMHAAGVSHERLEK